MNSFFSLFHDLAGGSDYVNREIRHADGIKA